MFDLLKSLFKSKKFIFGFLLFSSICLFVVVGPLISKGDPFEMVGGLFNSPSSERILGTDNFGRDVFIQLMYGIRTSLKVGFIAGIIATIIGVVMGAIAGYKGGTTEETLMGITNVFLTIPPIVILILLSIAIRTRTSSVIGLIIGITSWPWTARAVRAQASSLRSREHIDMAKISGFKTGEIIVEEILPYMLSYIVMAFILQVAGGILNEAALSMLGLGAYHAISLGIMLEWALLWEAVRVGAWWAFLPPAFFLTVITFSLMCMNTGMDEFFNPKLRRK